MLNRGERGGRGEGKKETYMPSAVPSLHIRHFPRLFDFRRGEGGAVLAMGRGRDLSIVVLGKLHIRWDDASLARLASLSGPL